MEMLLTIEQAAERLQLHRDTVRKQLKRGDLRGLKRGRVWRVPESALLEVQAPKVPTFNPNPIFPPGRIAPHDTERGGAILLPDVATAATPQEKAADILAALDSRDTKRRNAAIIRLAKSDAQTVEIVTAAAARAVEEWDGPEDDLSAWRNVDLKPHFPEEAPDYLEGLYRADDADADAEAKAKAKTEAA